MERGGEDVKQRNKEKEAALLKQLVMANTGSPETLQRTTCIMAAHQESPWMNEIDSDLRKSSASTKRNSRVSTASRVSRSSFRSQASVMSFEDNYLDGSQGSQEEQVEGGPSKSRKGSRNRKGKRDTKTRLQNFQQDLNTFHRLMAMADEADTPFINTTRANAYIGMLIMANCLSIGAETDFSPKDARHRSDPQLLSWYIVECVFTLIFTIECVWRLQVMGCVFWKSLWNIFDFVVVVFSILDACVLSWVTNAESGGGSQLRIMSVLRILRLLRLVRVLRLFRLFKELWLLLLAMWKALKGLVWVLMLLCITAYTCAILLTMMIGHRVKDGDPLFDQWGTVARSMFTLFIVMTGEGWNDIAIDAMELEPFVVLFFIPFVIFTNIMVLNLVVGITVQELLESKKQHELEVQRQFDDEAVKKLASIFATLDEDGSGSIEAEELREALQNSSFQAELTSLNIFVGEDAEMLMNVWDSDRSGQLNFNEFVQGAMAIMHCEVSQQILFLKYDVHSFSSKIVDKLDRIIEWQDEKTQAAIAMADPLKPKYPQKQKSSTALGGHQEGESQPTHKRERSPASIQARKHVRESSPASIGVASMPLEENLAHRRALMHSKKTDGSQSMCVMPSAFDSGGEGSSSSGPPRMTEVISPVSPGNTWEALPRNYPTMFIEDLHRVVTEQHNKLVVSIENAVNKAIKEQYAEVQKEMVVQRKKLMEDLTLCIKAVLSKQPEPFEDLTEESPDVLQSTSRGTISSAQSSSALRAAASSVPKPPEEPRIGMPYGGATISADELRSSLGSRSSQREQSRPEKERNSSSPRRRRAHHKSQYVLG